MASIWDNFDDIVDNKEVNEKSRMFEKRKDGVYKGVLVELSLEADKNNMPIVKGKFKTATGGHLFYNKSLMNPNFPDMTANNISKAVADFRALTESPTYEYGGLVQFEQDVNAFKSDKTYEVELKTNKKGFQSMDILGVCEPEVAMGDFEPIEDGDDDLPF